MIKKYENFEEDFEEDVPEEEFEPVLTEKEPMHYISTADVIAFIEKNSDMHWNQVRDYVYKEGILHHDGPDFYSSKDFEVVGPFGDLTNKWIGGFFRAHPWINQMMVVFDD